MTNTTLAIAAAAPFMAVCDVFGRRSDSELEGREIISCDGFHGCFLYLRPSMGSAQRMAKCNS